MKTLALTSPLEKGPDVKAAQAKLIRANFLKGTADGVFGRDTAAACVTAKRVLGYSVKKRQPVYGAQLDALLDKYIAKHKLPVKNVVHQKVQASKDKLAAQALKNVTARLGAKENPPNSNRSFVSVWYGLIGAWCAMTGLWGYDTAGSKYFNKKNGHAYGWAYVPNIVSDARRGLHGLSITHDPQPGTGVCYDWPGESPGLADHFGLFEKWIVKGKSFYAIEGNTAVGNDSDGGEIMRRERDVSLVLAFVHVAG